MYLHLGEGVVVPGGEVLAILDLDHISVSADSRAFLRRAQEEGALVTVGEDIPKAVVLCADGGRTVVYLTQLASATLRGRAENN